MVLTAIMLGLAHRGFPGWSTGGRAWAVVLLSQISVGALNDYVDRYADAIWQPGKPIPAGEIAPETALSLSVLAAALLVPTALTFGITPGLVACLGLACGLAYDLVLKKRPLSFVGYQGGFLSLVAWIWMVAGRPAPWLFALYPGAMLLIFAAHLAQSLPDVRTDAAQGIRGLAVVLGERRAVELTLGACFVTNFAALFLALLAGQAVAAGLGTLALLGLMLARVVVGEGENRGRLVLFFRLITFCIGAIAVAAVLGARSLGWV